jgi:cytochrome c553
MRFSTVIAAAMCLAMATPSLASDDRVEAGRAKAEQAGCNGCHGANGVATESGLAIDKHVPNLAAEPDLYVQFQLVFFRKGARKSEIMGPMAEPLTNEDIGNLGAYYASLAPPNMSLPPDPAPEETDLGERVARAIHCTSCHGDHFEGVDNIGRLAGQREDYLLKALRDFKSNARVATGAAGMSEVVYPLGDGEMMALAHYLSRIR